MEHLVTKEMREIWFKYNGWYADDRVILDWYRDTYSKKKKEKRSK